MHHKEILTALCILRSVHSFEVIFNTTTFWRTRSIPTTQRSRHSHSKGCNSQPTQWNFAWKEIAKHQHYKHDRSTTVHAQTIHQSSCTNHILSSVQHYSYDPSIQSIIKESVAESLLQKQGRIIRFPLRLSCQRSWQFSWNRCIVSRFSGWSIDRCQSNRCHWFA